MPLHWPYPPFSGAGTVTLSLARLPGSEKNFLPTLDTRKEYADFGRRTMVREICGYHSLITMAQYKDTGMHLARSRRARIVAEDRPQKNS